VVIVVVIALAVGRHAEWTRIARPRDELRGELQPIFARFLGAYDPGLLCEELRPAFLRMDAPHRAVAAILVTEIMSNASPSQKEQLRDALEESGIVELGERGTWRRSPWRRALACELLGKIGARRSVAALLARLEDRRPEVRVAAVRALGDIGSAEAVPALSRAFLERRDAPTNVVNNALRRIGGEAVTVFERGIESTDPIVRVSSCFGLSEMAEERGACTFRLAVVLDSDSDDRVRTSAAAALGILRRRRRARRAAPRDRRSGCSGAQIGREGAWLLRRPGRRRAARRAHRGRRPRGRVARGGTLLRLARRPRAAPRARALVESSSAWAVEYARRVEEVTA
jgi:hypothetical protein